MPIVSSSCKYHMSEAEIAGYAVSAAKNFMIDVILPLYTNTNSTITLN